MRFVARLTCCLVACTAFAAADAQEPAKRAPKDAAAIRKALDEKITLDFATQNLQEALEHLHQKTKIRFVLDNNAMQFMGGGPGIGAGIGGPGIPGFQGGAGMPALQLSLKSDNGKVRTALQNLLSPQHLSYTILADSVLISTEEFGYQRQMQQRVSVDVKEVALTDALKKLTEETGATLLIDPRQGEKAKGKISLQLDDVTLETALRLLTELGDLSTVRVGNVVFVTTEQRAEKLRKENQGTNPNFYGVPQIGFGWGAGALFGAPAAEAVPPPPPPVAEKK
jgi:type II secretory pathway component GspD/PulD (secretin)